MSLAHSTDLLGESTRRRQQGRWPGVEPTGAPALSIALRAEPSTGLERLLGPVTVCTRFKVGARAFCGCEGLSVFPTGRTLGPVKAQNSRLQRGAQARHLVVLGGGWESAHED